MMKSELTVFIYMSVCFVSVYCQYYYPFRRLCTEDAIRQSSEKTTCQEFRDEYDNVYDRVCVPITYVASKTISCMNISADYLRSYRESPEEGPLYPLKLKVMDSEISVLPTSTFKNLKNITVLVLENIKLKKIMPGAFNFLDGLKKIYLGQNEITTVSDGIFNSLTALEKVDLSRNRIETVTDDAFAGITISNLNLSNNRISTLRETLLSSLTHLSVLDMSCNNLQNVSDFRNLPIGGLNLSQNIIESVDFEVFPNSRIMFIDMSFNEITEVVNFNLSTSQKILMSHNRLDDLVINFNEYIQVIDISYNKVESIDFLNVTLVELYASFNLISSLSADTFSGLRILTHLYLDNNNISSIPNSCFKDLISLTHLNLSGNKLMQFQYGTFDNLKHLQVLDISDNNFKELPQYTFHSLNTLTHLSFQNNEISSINMDDLVQHMTKLVEINFNNNTWSCQKLINIVHKLKSKEITFHDGNCWEESNIHGIKCYETFKSADFVNISNAEINIDGSKLNSFFNEDFTKTILYKYFNQEFKNSEFFKYLESLRKSSNSSYTSPNESSVNKLFNGLKLNSTGNYPDFRKSEMYNFFNKDFANSSFFKYLQYLTKQTPNISKSEELAISKLDDMSRSFKNFTKELENILKLNTPKSDFEKTNMYNYFNKDFKTSNFFKYLERLNTRSVTGLHSENINESKADQLVKPIKINEYPVFIVYLNTTFLMLILVVILIAVYRLAFGVNKYVLPNKEEVELL